MREPLLRVGASLSTGANIWVSNALSNNITELRASDGKVLGTFPWERTESFLALASALFCWNIFEKHSAGASS